MAIARIPHGRNMASTFNRPVDPAADAAILLSRLGLATLAILAPCAAMASRRAIFTLTPVGALLILIAAALTARAESWRSLRRFLLSPIGVTALFLIFWSLLSLIWTPFPTEAAARYARALGATALASAAAAFLPASPRASNLYLLPFGAGFAALGAIFVAFAGPSLLATVIDGDDSTLERGVSGLVVLMWPALAALAVRERWTAAASIALLTAAAAIFANSTLALIGLAVGALAFAAAVAAPQAIARLLAAASALCLIAAPLLPLGVVYAPRTGWFAPDGPLGDLVASLALWRNIEINDGWRLATGHGLDTVTRGLARGLLPADIPGGILFEIWFELGVIGAVGYAWLMAQSFLAAGRAGAKLAPFAVAGLATALAMAMLSLSSAQLWWVNVLGAAGVSFTHVVRGQFLTRRLTSRRLALRPGSSA